MKKNLIVIAIAASLCLSVGAFFWLRHTHARHQLILGAVPPAPELSNASPILRARLGEIMEELGKRGHDVEALGDLSRLYHANGFMAEAATCYTGLEKVQPSEPRWWYRHATILAGYGDVESALPLLQQTLARAPGYTPARLRLADVYLKLNQPQQAAEIYEDVFQQDPNANYALLGLARIDYEAGHWEKARDRLERLVRQTNYQLGYDLIVEVYERLGERDRAEAIRGSMRASGAYRDPADPWLDELMDECFDPYRLALAAGAADRIGQMDTAARLLERAAQYSPNDVSPRFQLGNLYAQHGDMRAALPHFVECTKLAPDFADGWAFLSNAFSQLGDEPAATRTVLTGLAHCPDSPGLHLTHARQLRRGGQNDAAIEEFRATIRLRPNEADAFIELGDCLIGLGRVDEGIGFLKQSLVAEPDNPAALAVLAYHAISIDNEPLARQWLARIKLQPRMPRDKVEQLRTAFRQTFGKEP